MDEKLQAAGALGSTEVLGVNDAGKVTRRQLRRLLAEKLGYIIEEDLQLLTGTTLGTLEAWRKRRKGPPYVLAGNHVMYRLDSVRQWLDDSNKTWPEMPPADVL